MADPGDMAAMVVTGDDNRHPKAKQWDDPCEGDTPPVPRGTCNGVIALNVGGKVMMTSRTTFAAAPPDSLLARMFGPDADERWAPPRLPDGSYFLDLNPAAFGVVLDVLRHGADILGGLDAPARHMATVVCDYLGLTVGGPQATMGDDTDVIALCDRITVQVFGASALVADTFGLWRADDEPTTTVTLSREWPMPRVRDVLASTLKLAPIHLVVHQCLGRVNGTVRPEACLPLDSPDVTLAHVYRRRSARPIFLVHDALSFPVALPPATLCLPPPCGGSPVTLVRPKDAPVLLFVKQFDRAACTLSRAVPVLVDPRAPLTASLPDMRRALGIAADAHAHVFEEISNEYVEEVDVARTLDDNELVYGDILWIEIAGDGLAPEPIDAALVRERLAASAVAVAQ
ncbi:Ubiquitin-specific protease incomplete domain containing protein [Pandoravirus dulcis]|uniref:Ubiquitin-specific protease incomplete domain containing protein n=1 Tax=Pandoravirus dulcis TaxID=1349409 RepID=S4VQ57_9VIRU|nr:Ubiquitin-specific protease incomplete domain containing protein [Pandoravirus dulcis]AGO82458.2 Ubiquitin-specific protease incomplete domain containing protein [Pandoravirus dulcis]